MAELQEVNKEAAGVQPQSQPASLGEVLQAARVAKQLTQQDISNSLRYSVKQIDALENGEYHLLPDAMTTRGFIRNYARLLGLDAEPLLASYRQSVSSEPDKVIAVKSSMRPVQLTKESQPWLKYILASILVLLFLLAWLFYVDYMPKPSNVIAEKTPEIIEEVAPAVAEPLPEIALPTAERLAVDEAIPPDSKTATDAALDTATQSAAALDVKPAVASMVNTTDRVLTMTFTDLSWVSVTDKFGKVVYEKISHGGDKQTMNVTPPLNIVIGNASGTKLNFDGKDVDLAPNTKDNVARITLE